MNIAWIYLLVAGIFEAVWAVGLKYAQGFTRLWPSVITVVAMGISVYFLAVAVKSLPVGTAYAVWTGIGAVGTLFVGIIIFNDSASFWRMFSALLIVTGIVGLKLAH